MKKIFALMIVGVIAFSCKNANENQSTEPENNAAVASQTEVQPEAQPIDTAGVFDLINEQLRALNGDQFWSKDIFTQDYYDICKRLCDFSDGDALWDLGSIQELRGVQLSGISEFKVLDETHVTAESYLDCKDAADGMEGVEFRTLSLVQKDGKWLIEDVGFSKQEKIQAVKDFEQGNK